MATCLHLRLRVRPRRMLWRNNTRRLWYKLCGSSVEQRQLRNLRSRLLGRKDLSVRSLRVPDGTNRLWDLRQSEDEQSELQFVRQRLPGGTNLLRRRLRSL